MSSNPEDQAIAVGIPPEEGRFCADCKHLIGIRYKKDDVEKWNCGHPENTMWEKPNLITGIKKRISIRTLETLRYPPLDNEELCEEVCGREGKWYELYEEPAHYEQKEAPMPEYKPGTMKPSALAALTKKKVKDIGMDDL